LASAGVFDDGVLQKVCDVLGETASGLTGGEIGQLLARCRIDDPHPTLTKRHRLYEALRARQATDGSRNSVIAFVKQAMAPVRYVDNRELFEHRREGLNAALGFAGLELRATGEIAGRTTTTTLSEVARRRRHLFEEMTRRGIHAEVLAYCREELLAGDCFDMTFEATKGLMQRIRDMTGLTGDGAPLVTAAFAPGQTGQSMVAFNSLRTETELSEQKGLVNLMIGLYGTFRNPAGHAPKVRWHVSEIDALDLLTTLSFVPRRLDHAVVVP
jgi:uncharacterized protein (TIGR02391 family)